MEAVKVDLIKDTQLIFKKIVRIIVSILIIFIITMLSDKDVRIIFKVADPRLLIWMGFVCLMAIYITKKDFQQLCQDIKIVEDLESDFGRIDVANLKIPLETNQSDSFFVYHYAQICQISNITEFKEKALANEYFQVNNHLDLIASILALSGLAGTIMGLSKALAGISAGQSVAQGVAYAFGTTLLGIYGLISIYTLNNILREKKKEIFYNYLDLMFRKIKKED